MIEKLKAAYEASTPGEWGYAEDGFVYGDMEGTQPNGGGYIVSDPHSSPLADIDERESNAEFITLAHNSMPALLEAVDCVDSLLRCFTDEQIQHARLLNNRNAICTAEALLIKLRGETA